MSKTFPSDWNSIQSRIDQIDPIRYGRTRNFIDGAVTRLSPYISRGVISTNDIYHEMMTRGYALSAIEKFIQELAWRDYWQQVWIAKGDDINHDLRHAQPRVDHHQIPHAIVKGDTAIEGIDTAIADLYETGYMHNHVRMYVASIACVIGKNHWLMPAQWMYYHLLDGDWASNALSWQWVAGVNSNKQYVANQENINKYCRTTQRNTFLDVDYQALPLDTVPDQLINLDSLKLQTTLPVSNTITVDNAIPTLIYNGYNLDRRWKQNQDCNRILLLEPSIYSRYPVSDRVLEFIISLADEIDGIQLYVGEFSDLIESYNIQDIHYKEHPLNSHDTGIE